MKDMEYISMERAVELARVAAHSEDARLLGCSVVDIKALCNAAIADYLKGVGDGVELPEPALFAHELIQNCGGVWLGVNERGICEQAYVDGETSEKIDEFYTADQLCQAIAPYAARLKQADDVLRMAWAGYVNLSADMEEGPLKAQMRKHASEINQQLGEK